MLNCSHLPLDKLKKFFRKLSIDSMQKKRKILIAVIAIFVVGFIFFRQQKPPQVEMTSFENSRAMVSGEFDKSKLKTNAQWKKILTPEQYNILREAGTETPFTGVLNSEKRKGTYYSVGCDTPLFRSEQKYDSITGWPSFWAPIKEGSVVLRKESALGDDRIEVLDPCGGHLGHVFEDGPEPTGKRYCMNSLALKFVPDDNEK